MIWKDSFRLSPGNFISVSTVNSNIHGKELLQSYLGDRPSISFIAFEVTSQSSLGSSSSQLIY